MHRQTDKQKERLMEGWTEEGKGGHIDKQPSKKIDRQIDRQTDGDIIKSLTDENGKGVDT